MKFACACGATVHDGTDGLPDKAHVVADQDWFALLDRIDEAVERSGPTAEDKAAACHAIRSWISRVQRPAYRCRACGRLHLADATHAFHRYLPEDAHLAPHLLESRRGGAA